MPKTEAHSLTGHCLGQLGVWVILFVFGRSAHKLKMKFWFLAFMWSGVLLFSLHDWFRWLNISQLGINYNATTTAQRPLPIAHHPKVGNTFVVFLVLCFFGSLASFLLCIIDGWAFNWNWVVVITIVSGVRKRDSQARTSSWGWGSAKNLCKLRLHWGRSQLKGNCSMKRNKRKRIKTL